MDGIHGGEAKDSDTYTKDSSGEDDIDIEWKSTVSTWGGGAKEGGFTMEGGGGEDSSGGGIILQVHKRNE